ncbi:hypothetical protein, partial [Mycobacterium sp. E3339]|uniref:hypothetical protein n=1 Tax=Mycobacterium sp. E3339 TaxID=1834146 RepID=UPI001E36CAA3
RGNQLVCLMVPNATSPAPACRSTASAGPSAAPQLPSTGIPGRATAAASHSIAGPREGLAARPVLSQ